MPQNKRYRIVWNTQKSCWVVVSELSKTKGKKSNSSHSYSKISYAMFLGLSVFQVAPMAWSAEYQKNLSKSKGSVYIDEDQSLQIRTMSRSMPNLVMNGAKTTLSAKATEIISSGVISNGAEISSGGTQIVSTGGETNNTIVSAYSQQIISSGGVANSTSIIGTNAFQVVASGGIANHSIMSLGGAQSISGGTAIGAQISGGGIQFVYGISSNSLLVGGRQSISSGGQAINTIISNGVMFIHLNAQAVSTTVSGGNILVSSGGQATSTTVSGGNISVSSGGQATGTILLGGAVTVSSGGELTNTHLSNGILALSSGGQATDTVLFGGSMVVNPESQVSNTTLSGGYLQLSSGATATNLTQMLGQGHLITNTGATIVSGNHDNGSFSIAHGTATDMSLSQGDHLGVLSGHSAINTTVNSGGSVYVSSGGSAIGGTVTFGGTMVVDGGQAMDISLSGGTMTVDNSGTAVNTTVSSGNITVQSQGIATSTTMLAGGMSVSNGGQITDTVLSGGSITLSSGGQSVGVMVSGGAISIQGGASSKDMVLNGGVTNIYQNGQVDGIQLNSGAYLQVVSGGSGTNISQAVGGLILGNTQSFMSGTNALGESFYVSNGVAKNLVMYQSSPTGGQSQFNVLSGGTAIGTIVSGGWFFVENNGIAVDTTVSDLGTLIIQSGSILSGTTQLNGTAKFQGNRITNHGNIIFNLSSNHSLKSGQIIDGSGSLTKRGGNTLTLTTAQQYTGATYIEGGTVKAGQQNVISTSSELNLSHDGIFDLNGFDQNIQRITGGGGRIVLGENNLTLGSGLDVSVTATYEGALEGTGDLIKEGAYSQTLAGTDLSQFTGSMILNDGTLIMQGINVHLSGGVGGQSGKKLTLDGGTQLTTGIEDIDVDIKNGSIWNVSQEKSNNVGSLFLAGHVNLNNASGASNVLSVSNWQGSSGVLSMGVKLDSGRFLSSIADQHVVINGGSATGNTQVNITNLGGLGGQTTGDGIGIIMLSHGASSDPAAFTLAGHVLAGAYEYSLHQGSDQSWYLTSDLLSSGGTDGSGGSGGTDGSGGSGGTDGSGGSGGTDGSGGSGGIDGSGGSGGTDGSGGSGGTDGSGGSGGTNGSGGSGGTNGGGGSGINIRPNYRPEVSLDSVATAMGMMYGDTILGSLVDRRGVQATNYDAFQNNKNLWGRMIGQYDQDHGARNGIYEGGAAFTAKYTAAQVGVDIYQNTSQFFKERAGIYAAIGQGSGNGVHHTGEGAGQLKLDGYHIGGYWTRVVPDGWYMDAVAQVGQNHIKTTSIYGLIMKTHGWSYGLSLESGYHHYLGIGLSLEPHVQVSYQSQSLYSSSDRAASIGFEPGNMSRARFGIRVRQDIMEGSNSSLWFKPSVMYESRDDGAVLFKAPGHEQTRIASQSERLKGQLAVGFHYDKGQNSLDLSTYYDHSILGRRGRSYGGKLLWQMKF
jgi:antigen 43